ncbi:S8 family anti-phage peptidase IteS [Undibacterium sp. Tian12W]|uniref:S8 family anti-phage peptidase IteS n=1 Tax=Undibacterium sp. Tian12W TaxID=3413054 RepID=UPI003BF2B7D5
MATQVNRPERGSPKTTNPITHVSYERRDLVGVDPPSGGGGKELVPVTKELRMGLAKSMIEAANLIASEASFHPDVPGVMVMCMRDVAVAKSHRPLTLIAEANMPQAGHGEINEMLVAVNPVSIKKLEHVIKTRTTKAIRNNLSAVERFDAWDINRRLPKYARNKPLEQVLASFRQFAGRLMVRLFSHESVTTNSLIVERFEQLLLAHGITSTPLSQRNGPPLFLLALDEAMSVNAFTAIIQFQGIRHARPEPRILPTAVVMPTTQMTMPTFAGQLPLPGLPVVGVFDSGVHPLSTHLKPWVVSRDIYILPPDTDFEHGTAVASLLVDSSGLNCQHAYFPTAVACLIHDVCALESGLNGAPQGDLIIRLREAIAKQPNVKVWNLSLGGSEIGDDEFSEFGRELDALSDTYGVLFVVAAGNYKGQPRRGWPAPALDLTDRISTPADSVRALTVGAITHLESATSLVRIAEPAPYSRRGPGPVFTPKPDLVHVGGNADASLQTARIGVNILTGNDTISTGCGTSYAAPIAAGLAARTWQTLSTQGRTNPLTASPAMVKALMIHSAQLGSPDRAALERRYYGAGMPGDPIAVLYDADSSFTMMFELDIVDSMKWRKSPFPIPPSLLQEGKLKAEIIITVVYAPPVDSSKGAEYVRFNVDVGFGRLSNNAKGLPTFEGCVPAEGELGTSGFEEAQVEHGGKWSPVKTYRRIFPKGAAGNVWALQATLLRRAFEPPLAQPLRVVIAVTLRSIDGNPKVYQEGRRLLAATNWLHQDIATRITLPVRV